MLGMPNQERKRVTYLMASRVKPCPQLVIISVTLSQLYLGLSPACDMMMAMARSRSCDGPQRFSTGIFE